jgi:hypothetical protein
LRTPRIAQIRGYLANRERFPGHDGCSVSPDLDGVILQFAKMSY